jgi:hypothetical protein
MDRDHRKKPRALRAVTRALIGLELVSQLFALSLFPLAGTVVASDRSDNDDSWRRPYSTEASAAFLIQRLFQGYLTGTEPDDFGPDDCDGDQAEWAQVDAIPRQKFHSIDIVPPPPSHHHPLIQDRGISPHRTSRSAFRPIPLFRLTC